MEGEELRAGDGFCAGVHDATTEVGGAGSIGNRHRLERIVLCLWLWRFFVWPGVC
jgi:hypothetical protein